MTLDQLRIFIAVAERQHVTRAAEALNLAQSAVSASVAALEGQYRTKLFHRVGRGIELTEVGALFLEEARAVLSVVAGSLEAGLLAHVPFPLPARSFRLLRHRERHRSKAAEAMVAILGVAAG